MVSAPPFRRVLVANRGEIAIRVCRGLRECGVESVAVFSDADRDAAHRHAADHAVAIGGRSAAESYLDIARLLDAAASAGCDAVHPGYGFLSENAAFARAVEAAGLTFIGPTGDTMEQVGGKRAARRIAVAAGVPVVPGFDGDLPDDAAWLAKAEEIGFPLLVKASAGGGGKGMRLVERAADFLDALHAGKREAKSAFGDDRMLLERRVLPARHVEIQILGDLHGDVLSFHERECSVQRRHQKVLEEAPSPIVDPELRARMGEAAVRLAKAVGYRNAGTVEFLLDEDRRFYFLEVNTRLQVEHPVTECVTGLDLVHLQLAVAAGARLRDLLPDGVPPPRGHAIEARIYAEVPEQGFLPAAGRLTRVLEAEGPGIRVDSGVRGGAEITVHYDPMLAKLIVHAPDRRTACRRLDEALRDSVYLGIPTNVDFLRRVVRDARFVAGDLRTDMLDLDPDLCAPRAPAIPDSAYVAAILAAVLGAGGEAPAGAAGTGEATVGAGSTALWSRLAGFRVAAVGGAR
ncbi:MAG: ATP-grasp domain-containing protein [Planctomycetes bacterium]|nr:ATP-grasp domain-containing protein [Planctomycetota bacterium]